jgi:hypothetical protein
MDKLGGVLEFYFETGTEGGYWAFQDSRYIEENVSQDFCGNCGFHIDVTKGDDLSGQTISLGVIPPTC